MKPEGRMQNFISIDWDFFVFHPAQAAGGEDPHLAFDWGHNERLPLNVQDILWVTRTADFLAKGRNLEKEYTIRPDKGCVRPAAFASTLKKRFDFAGCKFFQSDSHAWSYYHGCYAPGAVCVTLFDAHHDLGYDQDKIAKEKKKGYLDCASWLFHLLHICKDARAVVVYPDWKGTHEWEFSKGQKHLRGVQKRIKITTWSEWVAERREKEKAYCLHLCRSSAWSPPWLDKAYARFWHSLAGDGGTCMDCMQPWTDNRSSVYDACKTRDWKLKYARQFMPETIQKAMEKRMRPAPAG